MELLDFGATFWVLSFSAGAIIGMFGLAIAVRIAKRCGVR